MPRNLGLVLPFCPSTHLSLRVDSTGKARKFLSRRHPKGYDWDNHSDTSLCQPKKNIYDEIMVASWLHHAKEHPVSLSQLLIFV